MEPKFKGSFVGQVVHFTSNVEEKLIPIENRETGEVWFMRKTCQTKTYYVWTGSKWRKK